ncbi:MAG: biopolymer transporter ExbD [Syntrophales bacterium]|nr:biopolymer transporter ExbD [Syntrophales bacterium]
MDEKEIDYINVIPFVDVMLVLLTIVLTASTFVVTGAIPVSLPRTERHHQDVLKGRVVSIDKEGTVFYESRRVTLDELRAELEPLDRELPMIVRADRHVELQRFVDVLAIFKDGGFRRVSIQTERFAGAAHGT